MMDSSRWEVAAFHSGALILIMNPFTVSMIQRLAGSWYSVNGRLEPAAFLLHVAVFFFVSYGIMNFAYD